MLKNFKGNYAVCFIAIVTVCVMSTCLAGIITEPAAVYAINDSREGWEEGIFNHLDYGIYWYQDGQTIPVKDGTEGIEIDPAKPTIIFTHGMKNNEGYNRRDLLSTWEGTYERFASFPYSTEYYQKYIDMGYNVGHFYWNQLAEEGIQGDPKIWSSDTSLGMRYYVSNQSGARVQGNTALNPTQSVCMLYTQAIVQALGKDFSGTLQLVGHSMGGDLSLAVGENLLMMNERNEISDNLVPDRITLLDPYLSITSVKGHIDHRDGEDANGRTIAELCSEAVVKLADSGVAIEGYGAGKVIYTMYSTLGASLYSKETLSTLKERLSDNITWVHLDGLDAQYGAGSTHNMVPDYYFLTLYQEPVKDNFGNVVPSALMDTETLRSLKGVAYSQSLNDGGNSVLMKDCSFVRVDREKNVVNLTITIPGDDVYGIVITDSEGNRVYTRTSSSPINYAEVGLPDGDYTVKLTQESGKDALAADKTVSVSQTVNMSIDKIELVNYRNNIILAVVIPVACVAIVAAVVSIILVKKKKTQK
ncbi:MAG: hypothetical protein ACI4MI_00810 [Christensenellales bacterium]